MTAPTDSHMTDVAMLLKSLGDSAINSGQSTAPASPHENKLAQVRLGIASSLFMALRCKHSATAGHSMRVALGCSAWALATDLGAEQRDYLEVAALLHDVGKIGVPDHILQKPGSLTADEASIVGQQHEMGLSILRCCCAPQEILDILSFAPAWYDGSKPGFERSLSEIPLGARMVAIVDAFDSMTTDHIYRRALSRERALVELYENAGKQFDPELVREFSDLQEKNLIDLHSHVSQRWLEALAPEVANKQWKLNVPSSQVGQVMPQTLFQQKLLDNMHDGVVFVDNQLQVFMWNEGAERLSGISGSAAHQRVWTPSLVQMRDERGSIVRDEECPVAEALKTGVQSVQRLSIAGRGNKDMPINLHVIPVIGREGTHYGATIMLHDASSETSLEERCEKLHSKATKDPLTQIANRAEFDRVHALFIKAHTESQLPCSLIICDIDHFKKVNDTYGHQAGDDAIKGFAALLKNMCRHGDLVARYGGEEFVMLCADCNNATAATRADQIRRALGEMPLEKLAGKRISASFGVTENQQGDTPETMLRRADRALLQAKAAGRNRVVQLGTGFTSPEKERRKSWWPFSSEKSEALIDTTLVTDVPVEVVVEKLRGYVADHEAQINWTGDEQLELVIDGNWGSLLRRRSDRGVPFLVEIDFDPNRDVEDQGRNVPASSFGRTKLQVTIRPRRDRDRRLEKSSERARHLLNSLKSYLMAREEEIPEEDVLAKAKKAIKPWLKKKLEAEEE